MISYKVTFIKMDKNEEGKDQLLGSVIIDDTNTDRHLTVQAKAFRRAPEACLVADKVRVDKI